ncbi:MAG: hypothetical protein WCA84_08975 [Ignavibacteriaceae bacterium]|jgi:hypothetical protein
MKVGDIVKYHFPVPENENKKFILAIISFISDSKLVLDCEDGTCLMISFRNFDRVEIMRSITAKEKNLVA